MSLRSAELPAGTTPDWYGALHTVGLLDEWLAFEVQQLLQQ